MRLRLIRHATLVVEFAGRRLLVDPMLAGAGAAPPIENSPNPRPNPLVELPEPGEEVLRGVDAVLVTHTHRDHWDDAAVQLIPKDLPLFGQRQDQQKFREAGFARVFAVADSARFDPIEFFRTGGQHGTGRIAQMLAPVSGFVLRAPGEPTLYLAGDTIWCAEVQAALDAFSPAVVVVNAGGARFLEGDPITMTPADVMAVCQAAPKAQVVAAHMEAINHCIVGRDDLRFQLEAERMGHRVAIPADGETLTL